jgi:hypothetical protein
LDPTRVPNFTFRDFEIDVLVGDDEEGKTAEETSPVML